MKRKVIRIIDGDSFVIDRKIRGIDRIRMRYPNTPERKEKDYEKAKDMLEGLISSKEVNITPVAIDVYGRVIGTVSCNGRNINKIMQRELLR